MTQTTPQPYSEPLLTAAELHDAQAVVAQFCPRTPTYRWPLLDELTQAQVFVKHENMTPTAAFKMRGGLVLLQHLKESGEAPSGVISATRGNHGISLAFAGAQHDVPVVVVVPEGNSAEKNAAIRALGAELIVHGQDFAEAVEHAGAVARERGLFAVPAFHPALVAGVATYSWEWFQDAGKDGDLDAVLVPVGMGSGICAAIAVRDLMGLSTEIFGVTATGARAQALTFAAGGNVVTTPSVDTFVDGVATRSPDATASAIIASGAAGFIEVADAHVERAMREMWRCLHHIAEPAGALGLAALLAEPERWTGKRVGIVLSGSNVDGDTLIKVMNG